MNAADWPVCHHHHHHYHHSRTAQLKLQSCAIHSRTNTWRHYKPWRWAPLPTALSSPAICCSVDACNAPGPLPVPCCGTNAVSVLPLVRETKFQTHTRPGTKIRIFKGYDRDVRRSCGAVFRSLVDVWIISWVTLTAVCTFHYNCLKVNTLTFAPFRKW